MDPGQLGGQPEESKRSGGSPRGKANLKPEAGVGGSAGPELAATLMPGATVRGGHVPGA